MRRLSVLVACVGLMVGLGACQPAPAEGPTAVAKVGGKAVFSIREDMSSDGRYVVFLAPRANDVVPGFAPNKPTAYRWDRKTNTYAAVSVAPGGGVSLGEASVNHSPDNLHISDDGRYVVFTAFAINLVPNDIEGKKDVFVRDMTTGVTTRVSQTAAGAGANQVSDDPEISANGRWIVYESLATNLPGAPGDGLSHMYRYDVVNHTTVRADLTSTGGSPDAGANTGRVDNAGRVYFRTSATNVVASPAKYSPTSIGVYVRDIAAGTTTPLVFDTTGKIRTIDLIAVTPDGRYLLLDGSPNVFLGVAGTDNPFTGMVLDRTTGTLSGVAKNTAGSYYHMDTGSISADGRWVAFGGKGYTTDTPMVANASQLYYTDRTTGVTRLANRKADGTPGGGIVQPSLPLISNDGRIIVFETLTNVYTPDSPDATLTKVMTTPTNRP